MSKENNYSIDQEKIVELKSMRGPLVEEAAHALLTCLTESTLPEFSMDHFEQICDSIVQSRELTPSERDEMITLALPQLQKKLS